MSINDQINLRKQRFRNYFLLAILLSRSFSKARTSQRSENSFRVKKLKDIKTTLQIRSHDNSNYNVSCRIINSKS